MRDIENELIGGVGLQTLRMQFFVRFACVLPLAVVFLSSCASSMLSHSSLAGLRWDPPGAGSTPSNRACAARDIQATQILPLVDPMFRGAAVPYRLAGVDGGPFFEVSPGIEMEYEKKAYSLRLMRLVSPSEHQIVGAAFLLEWQLFFASANSEPLIVSLLVHKGVSAPALVRLIQQSKGLLHPGEWMPRYAGHYAYRGVLPGSSPCRGVRRIVMRSAIEISADDLETFLKRWGSTPVKAQLPHAEGVQESE